MPLLSVLTAPASTSPRHRPLEDLQALLTGPLLAALGIVLFQQAGLVPGGTVGLALLLHYASGVPVAWALMAANAPFYALALLRMGREFTLKTLVAVVLMSAFTAWLPQGLAFQHLSAPLAAVLGGLLCGVAMLVVFRHRASLGGMNVLALYAQEKWKLGAGKLQMAIDAAIVLGGGLLVAGADRIAASVLAVVVLNLVLAVNHRPGRYMAG